MVSQQAAFLIFIVGFFQASLASSLLPLASDLDDALDHGKQALGGYNDKYEPKEQYEGNQRYEGEKSGEYPEKPTPSKYSQKYKPLSSLYSTASGLLPLEGILDLKKTTDVLPIHSLHKEAANTLHDVHKLASSAYPTLTGPLKAAYSKGREYGSYESPVLKLKPGQSLTCYASY